MFQLLQSTELVADSLGAVPKVEQVAQELTSGDVRWDQVMTQLVSWSLDAGKHILIAVVLFVIGHYLIKLLNYLLARFLERRKVEVTVQTFVRDFVGILLQVLLIITVVSALGVNTTSFAALLASFGVAIGMALSGTLQNFSGGLLILAFKPFKVGDFIEAQGYAGTVTEMSIVSTRLTLPDNRSVTIPHGPLANGNINNYTRNPFRRLEWKVGLEYGVDAEACKAKLLEIAKADGRVLDASVPGAQAPMAAVLSTPFTITCQPAGIFFSAWAS